MLPIGSFAWPEYTTSRLTGRVTPLILRYALMLWCASGALSIGGLLSVSDAKCGPYRKTSDLRRALRVGGADLTGVAYTVGSPGAGVSSSPLKLVAVVRPVKARLT